MTDKILRFPDVKRFTGLGRSTIYDFIAKGSFPKPVKLGPRAVGWHSADIAAWIESREARA
ncbi:MAG: hypothetical protein C0454_08650 [Parvibaculum sp.]|nr:hypothetical protein [Parvibaculum sp.]